MPHERRHRVACGFLASGVRIKFRRTEESCVSHRYVREHRTVLKRVRTDKSAHRETVKCLALLRSRMEALN